MSGKSPPLAAAEGESFERLQERARIALGVGKDGCVDSKGSALAL